MSATSDLNAEHRKGLCMDLLRSHSIPPHVTRPPEHLLSAPVKVLQFGTGRFLRAFADWMLQRASSQGVYHARAVVIQSTSAGAHDTLVRQDGLFTVVERGIDDGGLREMFEIVGSIASAVDASSQWPAALELAANPQVNVVVSNTTEVGIAAAPDDALDAVPPKSYPAKLTAWLWRRFQAVGSVPESAVLVLPCELVDNNGDLLRSAVEGLAARWKLPIEFLQWLNDRVSFCNTLVDRIVTGFPPADELADIQAKLGYQDDLLNMCEPYHLWAIQADPDSADMFPLHKADLNVVFTSDVTPYRNRKVRLLNGSHSLMSPAACLAGCTYVRDTVGHPLLSVWVRRMLFEELVPSLPYPRAELIDYAETVLRRFANPYLRHRHEDILVNTAVKLRTRVVPTVVAHAARTGAPPRLVAFGYAAWITLLLESRPEGEVLVFAGPCGRVSVRDPLAVELRRRAGDAFGPDEVRSVVHSLLADRSVWDADLCAVPGFADEVAGMVLDIRSRGIEAALSALLGIR
ncbi:MAG: tagaturonate reductase [Armatimonadota bacterium]